MNSEYWLLPWYLGVKVSSSHVYNYAQYCGLTWFSVLDDNTCTNKIWAKVSGISLKEIHIMEVEFLSNIQYNLFASEDEWIKWHAKLKCFSAFYHEAFLVPRVNEQLVSNNPTIHILTRLGPKLLSLPLYPAYKLLIFPNWSLPVGGAIYTPVLPQLGNKMPLLLNTWKCSCGEPPMEHPVKKSCNIYPSYYHPFTIIHSTQYPNASSGVDTNTCCTHMHALQTQCPLLHPNL